MEEFLPKAKHYQIFLSLTAPALFAAFIPDFHPNVELIKMIMITIPYVVWIFILGRALNSCVPGRYRLNEIFLTINLFFFCIVFAMIAMLLDLTINFHGWATLIPLYMVFSFLYLFYFASKALTSAEQKRRTSFSNHFAEMLILMSGYLGIWYIQPRINALWEANKSKFLEDQEEENYPE